MRASPFQEALDSPTDLARGAHNKEEAIEKIEQAKADLQKLDEESFEYQRTLVSIAFSEKTHLERLSDETLLKLNEFEAYLTSGENRETSTFLLQKVDLI